jgi:Rps23 Pro-64 3,4-dihydroxylase Tpa1-like proline 4-hydroxylase
MIKDFDISEKEYQTRLPYPYHVMDNVLNEEIAIDIQNDILSLPIEEFDRYENPFEQKYTLRDKNKYPQKLQALMNYLTNDEFVNRLSQFVGCSLQNDSTKNFYGVHIYKPGDKLDIHVDAGLHPTLGLKKYITLGIYLSKNWKTDFGCELEIWDGDPAHHEQPKLYKCMKAISPVFNRMILFTNTDNSWHGNPNPVLNQDPNARRIFVTLSYLRENDDQFHNKKMKAYFIARPYDKPDPEKDILRELRANINTYKNVYRTM